MDLLEVILHVTAALQLLENVRLASLAVILNCPTPWCQEGLPAPQCDNRCPYLAGPRSFRFGNVIP
jgi:hypothetical protein